MARAARSLSGQLRAQIDQAADAKPWSLVVVAMLAVGREGLETALFLWAATQAAARDTGATATPLLGAALGLAVAVVLGYLIYRGALKINLTRFFTWTGAFLIIVAAGVLAYGVHDLQEARFLPGLNNLAFDVSHVDPAELLVRHPAQGHLQLLPRHHQARGHRLAALRGPDHDALPRPRSAGARHAARPARHRRSRPRRKELTIMTAAHPPRPAPLAGLRLLALPLLAACTDNAPDAGDPGATPPTRAR